MRVLIKEIRYIYICVCVSTGLKNSSIKIHVLLLIIKDITEFIYSYNSLYSIELSRYSYVNALLRRDIKLKGYGMPDKQVKGTK